MKFHRLKRLFPILFSLSIFFVPQFCGAASPTNVSAPTGANVLVVYNSNITTNSDSSLCGSTQDSLCLAQYYATARNIPAENVLGLPMATDPNATGTDIEVINSTQYLNQIATPLQNYLSTATSSVDGTLLKNKIRDIVLMMGVPLKISEVTPDQYEGGSVDAAVSILFQPFVLGGQYYNPYFNVDTTFGGSYRFTPFTFSQTGSQQTTLDYIVTRLDGETVDNVKGMVDRSIAADTSGSKYFVIDDSQANIFGYKSERTAANATLRSFGYNDVYNSNGTILTNTAIMTAAGTTSAPMIGYSSDGTHEDPTGMSDDIFDGILYNDNLYANGAVAGTDESFGAWTITGRSCLGQNCISTFINEGGSGGFGDVYEPSGGAFPYESVWMPAYARGYTWGEAAYMSQQFLDWQEVVLGDPLMTINALPFEGIPSAPGNVSAIAGNASAVVNFDSSFGSNPAVLYYAVISSPSNIIATSTQSPITITGLQNGTTYSLTVEAVNSLGTSTSNFLVSVTPQIIALPTLTTSTPTSITPTSATLNASITNRGGASSTIEGFNYGTSTAYGSTASTSGVFGINTFSQSINGLICNTTYHAQAFAINTGGTATSSDMVFSTIACPVLATIATSTPTNIAATSVTLNGVIVNDGGASSTLEGFAYGSTTAYGATTTSSGTFGVGLFSANISSLVCATTYHYNAYSSNSVGISTTTDSTFTTSSCPVPVVYSGGGGGGGGGGGSVVYASPVSTVIATTTSSSTNIIPTSIICPAPFVCVKTAPAKVTTSILTTSVSSSFTQNLGIGSSGSQVTNLQSLLESLGYFNETPTGYYGPVTEAAVRAYQIADGISPLGIVGPMTRALLNNQTISNSPISSTSPTSVFVTLSAGSISPAVYNLQVYLNSHGYLLATLGPGSPGNETNTFGNLTKTALKAFQVANNLPATGVYDQATQNIINISF